MKIPDLEPHYLGQTTMTRDTKVKAEERFPITGHGFASGNLLDSTSLNIVRYRCHKVLHVKILLSEM